jgi:hypothetical protein
MEQVASIAFEETCLLHIQGWRISQARNQPGSAWYLLHVGYIPVDCTPYNHAMRILRLRTISDYDYGVKRPDDVRREQPMLQTR